jgi:ABC-type transporter Mla subunit MlaD
MSNEVRIGGNAYGPVATGSKARATQRNVTIGDAGGGGEGLSDAFETLRRAFDEHRDQIPQAARVAKDIDALERETTDPDPDADNVRDTLGRIAGRVGMVATVLAAAENLRETVEAILH